MALASALLPLLALAPHAGGAALAPGAPAALQPAFEHALKQEGLVGAVWGTVGKDGAVATGAAGLKNAATGEPMTADSKVHVGSVAKTVLALGVLRLITDGRLALDTPVAPMLPGVTIDNPWNATDPVLVRHLLAHTAGLDNVRFWQMFSKEPRADTPLAQAFLGDPTLLKVNARPGSRFAYSNISYTLLGMVIESASGERYERYLDSKLLQPLGMADSTFEFVSQEGAAGDKRLAMGHFENSAPHAAVPIYLRPASQFTTTAADMARFAAFLMGDGAGLVQAGLMAQLERPSGTDAAKAGLLAGHGLALAVRDRHGVVGGCHPGVTVGFSAMLCVYRPQGKAFFAAFNADVENANYEQFYQRLISELGLPQPGATDAGVPAAAGDAAANLAEAKGAHAAWDGVYVPVSFTVSSFAWADVVFNFMRVESDGARLQLVPFQGKSKLLRHAGGGLYRAGDRVEPSHVLLRAEHGRGLVTDGLRTFEQASWTRMALLWASMAAGLGGLLYVLVGGVWRLRRAFGRRQGGGAPNALALPLAATLALLLPVPFFLTQSFLELGDRTAASLLLMAVTAALAPAMAWGLWRAQRARAWFDCLALVAILQFLAVLAAWGLIPFRLWA